MVENREYPGSPPTPFLGGIQALSQLKNCPNLIASVIIVSGDCWFHQGSIHSSGEHSLGRQWKTLRIWRIEVPISSLDTLLHLCWGKDCMWGKRNEYIAGTYVLQGATCTYILTLVKPYWRNACYQIFFAKKVPTHNLGGLKDLLLLDGAYAPSCCWLLCPSFSFRGHLAWCREWWTILQYQKKF